MLWISNNKASDNTVQSKALVQSGTRRSSKKHNRHPEFFHGMGIIKFLVVSAAGIWSARAVARLNLRVARIKVPTGSSLNRISNGRADTFVIELPKRIAHSNVPASVDDFARSFYRSVVFRSFEKPLLKLVYNLKEPSFDQILFYPGDRILLWTVKERNRNEILLEWQASGFRGYTWFHVDQSHLMFGSSVNGINTNLSPTQLVLSSVDLIRNNPHEQSLGERLWKCLNNFGIAGVLSIHHFYSRLLLDSTLRTLVLEQS